VSRTSPSRRPPERAALVRLSGALLAAAVLALPLHARHDEPAEESGVAVPRALAPAARAIVAALRELRRARTQATEEQVAALEPEVHAATAFALDLLAEQRIPALDLECVQTVSLAQRDLLLGAIARLEERGLRATADAWLALADDPAHRAVVLELFGRIGRADDLTPILRMATPESGLSADPRLETACREALARILDRESDAPPALVEAARDASPMLIPTVVRAFGDAHEPAGVGFLLRAAEATPEHLPLILATIQRMGPSLDLDASRDLADRLRPELDSERSEHFQAACRALSTLGDLESIPIWIERLDESPPLIRDCAQRSLCAVTGLGLPPVSSLWARWYEAELAFERAELADLERAFSSFDPGRVADAMKRARGHALVRHEVARALAAADLAWDLDLFAARCGLLAELGSPAALPWLVDELADERCAPRAVFALTAITGLELPPEEVAWRDALPRDVLD
jgi:hypothetical protein